MNPTVALALCTTLVASLLLIERWRNAATSWALWVPTVWMLICGSRAVGSWFLVPGQAGAEETSEAGSPLDRLVLTVLLSLAIVVLVKRKVAWTQVVKDNMWLVVLFMYMAASCMWSEFPFVSFKRWIRAVGPALMALVILSEQSPSKAFETVFRRTAYVLIPFSLLIIKYYPLIGVAYGRWDGQQMWTGATTHKNSLGQLCAVSVFVIFWDFLKRRRSGQSSPSRLQPLSDGLVILIALYLLRGPAGSYSATSIAILLTGSAIALMLYSAKTVTRLVAMHLRVFLTVLVLTYWLLAQPLTALVTSSLGRDETLTGRTEIWEVLREVAARSPIVGLGYGGFWGLHPEATADVQVGEGHNGYLDIYLELGIIGLVLLTVFILSCCGRVRHMFEKDFDWSVLVVCFLLLTLLYNLSESAFFTNGFLWTTTVFVVILFSSIAGANSHSIGAATDVMGRPATRSGRLTASIPRYKVPRRSTNSSGRRRN